MRRQRVTAGHAVEAHTTESHRQRAACDVEARVKDWVIGVDGGIARQSHAHIAQEQDRRIGNLRERVPSRQGWFTGYT